jgi:nucleoside-diphosphate-sugar epimerase
MSTVLVTGGSGFVGSHTIVQLLNGGHAVRTTLRSQAREADVRAMVRVGGAQPGDRLSFCVADLEADSGWADAMAGCTYVLHVASPFPAGEPKDEDEVIAPAREGTLRVLRAARDAGVKRVVMTSSFAAVGYGHAGRNASFTEEDWTDTSGPDVAPYIKSKALAERAAWDFMTREGGALELAVINPVGVFGPVLGPDYSSSIGIIKSLLDGEMPMTPHLHFGVVDVRDVADLHLKAMTSPQARGQRFIAVAGPAVSMGDVAKILRARLGDAARKVPRFDGPNWLFRVAAMVMPQLKGIVPQLGIIRNASNEKAKRLLHWNPRPAEEAIVATAESLLAFGLVKGTR